MRFRETDLLIFEHIRQFRLATNVGLAETVFADIYPNYSARAKAAGEASAALTRQGYLMALQLLRGHKCYMLTQKATSVIGEIPNVLTAAPGPQRLDFDLAVECFCCYPLKKVVSHRLDRDDLAELYPNFEFPQNVVHTLREEDGGPIVYRMYLCSAGKTTRCIKHIHRLLAAIAETPAISTPDACPCGLAVMAPTSQATDALRDAIKNAQFNYRRKILVTQVGTSETLHAYSKVYKSQLGLEAAA